VTLLELRDRLTELLESGVSPTAKARVLDEFGCYIPVHYDDIVVNSDGKEVCVDLV
jgi:hypothetical protein